MLGHMTLHVTAKLSSRISIPFYMYMNLNCSPSSLALDIVSIFYFSHCNRYVLLSHCGFTLNFFHGL